MVNVWPDNWLAVTVFEAMGTQWTVSHSGPIGLRYEALREVRLAYRIKAADWPDVFDAVRVMESAARDVLRSKQ